MAIKIDRYQIKYKDPKLHFVRDIFILIFMHFNFNLQITKMNPLHNGHGRNLDTPYGVV